MGSKGIQTEYGKAFEYACLMKIHNILTDRQKVHIEDSLQLDTARKKFETVDDEMKEAMTKAAEAACRVVMRLEPQLRNSDGNEPLFLSIQSDAAGAKGDVRDIICARRQNGWEIGLSCKHNHHAVKHSRLSASIDFGKEWLGIPCSDEYFSEIVPLFEELRSIRDESKADGRPIRWNEIQDKADRYYVPILEAFKRELNRIYETKEKNIPEALVRYLLGRNDFYKIITDDSKRTTRIEAFNLEGTLNRRSGPEKSITSIPMLKMPTRFYFIDFKEGSDNTLEVVCDNGWQISMRIHNASSIVEPSLKFDVNLVSVPSNVYAQVEPWDVDMKTQLIMEYHNYQDT